MGNETKIPTYDVAVSFAGEDRDFVKTISDGLVVKGLNVFYDEYEKANFWGKDLYSHLTKVYRDESKYCLMIISEFYIQKQWTNHERKAAQARAFKENAEYILPLRLDDTSVEGVLETTGFIDARSTSVEEIIDLTVAKVRLYNSQHGIRVEIVRAEEVFKKQNLRPKGGKDIRDSDMETECNTCGSRQHLSEAPVSLDGEDTVYTCKNGCHPIVVISRPGIVAWPGRGYRLGNYMIRNSQDISISVGESYRKVLIPKSEAALMKKRPKNS